MIIDFEQFKREHAPELVQYPAERDADEPRVGVKPYKDGEFVIGDV